MIAYVEKIEGEDDRIILDMSRKEAKALAALSGWSEHGKYLRSAWGQNVKNPDGGPGIGGEGSVIDQILRSVGIHYNSDDYQ